jgi:hypothetical protein
MEGRDEENNWRARSAKADHRSARAIRQISSGTAYACTMLVWYVCLLSRAEPEELLALRATLGAGSVVDGTDTVPQTSVPVPMEEQSTQVRCLVYLSEYECCV